MHREATNLRGLHNSNIIPSVHPWQRGGEEVAVSRLVSIKHGNHFHLRRSGVLAIDLLQAAVQVGRLGVRLVLALVPVNPDDWDAVNLEQLLCQLLTKSDSQEGLPFELLLVVLGSIITQVDVHCK